MKNIIVFYLKIFCFLEVKLSIYLNRHVFVMFCQEQMWSSEFLKFPNPLTKSMNHEIKSKEEIVMVGFSYTLSGATIGQIENPCNFVILKVIEMHWRSVNNAD